MEVQIFRLIKAPRALHIFLASPHFTNSQYYYYMTALQNIKGAFRKETEPSAFNNDEDPPTSRTIPLISALFPKSWEKIAVYPGHSRIVLAASID